MLNPDLHLNKNVFNKDVEKKPTRNGFGEGLVELGALNPNVVALTADLSESTRNETFAKKYPERFIECGVAEQNMAAVAAGLAASGKTAFISSYATFSPGKNWETIRTTIVYNNADVKVAGHHSGIVTGPDGATHQATEDIASTRCWPNIQVVVPTDVHEARKATIASGQTYGPFYLRFTRDNTPIITTPQTPFQLGKIQTYWISHNPKAVIFATGHLLYHALLAADELHDEGIQVLVANVASIKPLDENSITKLVAQAPAVVTVEDHQVSGGLGGAIAEYLAKTHPVPMEFIGLQDTFGETGSADELIKAYGLDKDAIKKAVKKVIRRKVGK